MRFNLGERSQKMQSTAVQENDHQASLWKAAWRRLDDAWELLEIPTRLTERSDCAVRHLAAAEYIAGYSVECLLKVYIIQMTTNVEGRPAQRWREVTKVRQTAGLDPDLSGAKSHKLDQLVVAAQLEPDFENDDVIKRAFNLTFKWRVSLRYRAFPYGSRDKYGARAKSMVHASQTVCDWLRQKIFLPPD
jgi:hypothetical protein